MPIEQYNTIMEESMKQSLFGVCFALLFSLFSAHATEDYWRDTLWIRKIPLGGNTYAKIMFHPDGKSVFAASDQYLFEYDVMTGEILKIRQTQSGLSIADYELTSDNKQLIIGTYASGTTGKCVMEIWDMEKGFTRKIPLEYLCLSIALSSDNQYVYVGYEQNFVEKFMLETGVKVTSGKGGGEINVSPDGTEMISTFGYPGTTYLLDASTLEYKKTIISIGRTNYDKTGRYICGAGANNIVYLYDRETNTSYPLENHKGQLSDVCFTSDGKYVLSVSTNNPDAPIKGGYKVTDVELKKTIYEASGPATGIYVAISPDNSAITTLSTTDFLRTWKTSAWTATSVLNNNDDDNVISIFPNPTHTFIKIDFPPNTLNGKLILLDIHGQKVIENDINEQIASNGSIHCDISSLPNGSYLCRIHFNNTTYSSSFIINR